MTCKKSRKNSFSGFPRTPGVQSKNPHEQWKFYAPKEREWCNRHIFKTLRSRDIAKCATLLKFRYTIATELCEGLVDVCLRARLTDGTCFCPLPWIVACSRGPPDPFSRRLPYLLLGSKPTDPPKQHTQQNQNKRKQNNIHIYINQHLYIFARVGNPKN